MHLIMGKSHSKDFGESVKFKELASTTPFTVKQLKEWHTEFIKDCPNGEMDRQTFMENFGTHFFPADGNTKKLAEYVFKRFDTNKDGSISFPEFIKAVSIPAKGTIDEKLDWAFSIYDIDDDGYITTEEMLNVVKAIFQRRGLKMDQTDIVQLKVEEIFSRMDVNNDGKLSKEEFIKGFKTDPQILRALVAKEESTSSNFNQNSNQKQINSK